MTKEMRDQKIKMLAELFPPEAYYQALEGLSGMTDEKLQEEFFKNFDSDAIVDEDILTDMFGEGGKEEVKEYYN